MRIVKEYKTETEASGLKVTYSEMYLVETQNYEDGNFLVFADVPRPATSPTVEERLADIETRLTTLEAVN